MPEGIPLPLGVVQSLANHEPDVDAVCRLALPAKEGGLRFDFGGRGSGTSEEREMRDSSLKIVPDFAFTPYNSQVTPQRSQKNNYL